MNQRSSTMKPYFATFHYKGEIIHKQHVTSDNEHLMMKQADDLIKHTLKQGVGLKRQIEVFKNTIKSNQKKIFYKYPISPTDGMLGALAIYALCRLNQLQLDETTGCIITKTKPRVRARRRVQKQQVVQAV